MNLDGKNRLHEAAQNNDVRTIQLLLGSGFEIDSLKRGDWTALMLAVAKGNEEATQYLLTNGASILHQNRDGWTSLHLACRHGSLPIVKLILKHAGHKKDALCSIKSKNGRSALHIAALHGYKDLIKMLLFVGWPLGVDCRDNCGTTPLMDAIRAGQLATADYLVSEWGADLKARDSLGRNLVAQAAQANCIPSLEFILQKSNSMETSDLFSSRSIDEMTPLMLAAREGNMEAVRFLTDYSNDRANMLNARDSHARTALDHATIANRRHVAEYLICQMASVKDNQEK